MESKKPNKSNKSKKPVVDKKTISSISNDQIKSLLKDVMMKSIEEKEIKREIELDTISSTIEEFLRCFILVGYDLNNEPVLISNAKTQLDADALSTAFTKAFFSMNRDF